uniref:Uncharacterized protein n=1 Tax=Lepeophtheirus salmonis TaxID=72036 RepID=A0A0K2UDF3_LEPSM
MGVMIWFLGYIKAPENNNYFRSNGPTPLIIFELQFLESRLWAFITINVRPIRL